MSSSFSEFASYPLPSDPLPRARLLVILFGHGKTEFNRIFSVARRDPGIRDPQPTENGRQQVAAAGADAEPGECQPADRQPYGLETTDIIAMHLDLPINRRGTDRRTLCSYL